VKGKFLFENEWNEKYYECTICRGIILYAYRYCPSCGSPTTEEVIHEEKYRDYQ
jgi:rRNA maturation endonuclease Nob1